MVECARPEAALGGMRFTMPSLRSGLRCYVAFVSSDSPVSMLVIKIAFPLHLVFVFRCNMPGYDMVLSSFFEDSDGVVNSV